MIEVRFRRLPEAASIPRPATANGMQKRKHSNSHPGNKLTPFQDKYEPSIAFFYVNNNTLHEIRDAIALVWLHITRIIDVCIYHNSMGKPACQKNYGSNNCCNLYVPSHEAPFI